MAEVEVSQKPTAIVTGPVYSEHDTGGRHPENQGRLAALAAPVAELLNDESGRFVSIEPQEAALSLVGQVHDAAYIEALGRFCASGERRLELDTNVSVGSFEAALCAAGGLVQAVDAVLAGEVQNAFALVRPPGHHAVAQRAMGFCLFNNVAIAARYLIEKHGLSRVLIVDWDVHHGNGTQDAFYNDPQVLFYSTHQSPLYPGTGYLDDVGHGKGRGYTANLPLPAGAGDEVMLEAFTEILEPLAARFKPEFILVSAGYDAHWREALYATALTVSTPGFAEMTARVKRLAETFCDGRLALSLEGGYDQQALSASVRASLRVLAGETPAQAAAHDTTLAHRALPADHDYIQALLKEARKLHTL